MEMSHQSGTEAESLLRSDQRSAVVMPGQRRWDENGEKAPFLRNEPVKLTPAWEGANLPNDTLNLKGVGTDLVPPSDKYNLIYLTLVLHGLGTLTAWNMFITAKSYFEDYKLVNTEYKAQYMVFVTWASQVPNVLFSWFNLFVTIGGKLSTRIVCALIIEVIIFVITIVLAMVDTTEHVALFFWTTMALVFILNGTNAIFQNSVFGIAAKLPPAYTGAVVLGNNVCGTLVSLLSMTTQLASSLRTAAIYYFIVGMFVLLVCFDTYFALPLNRFYRYHDTLQERTMRNNPALAASPAAPSSVPWGTIFRQSAPQLYNVFLTFVVSLAVFPTVMSDIKIIDPGFILGSQFTPVGCFLTFNLCAMIGNITASSVQFPSAKWLWIPSTLRLAFVPFFLLCNYLPPAGRTLAVLVNNDWAFWVGGALIGWSHGHISSLGMMYVTSTVAPEFASKAGMIGGATLITGIFIGIALSGLWAPLMRLALWKDM